MSDHAHDMPPEQYGLLAEFADADTLVAGIQRAKAEGYTLMDAYTPYPVGEAADALGFPKSEMGTVMFIGALVGASSGFLMQYYLSASDYPINVAGRPLNSWPQFIPITFEMGVLTTALVGLFALIALCGLPQLYHPLFNVPSFSRANRDRFFLCIEADDPKFDLTRTREFLLGLQPLEVSEVPR
jgi:hypothetical protein